MNTLPVDISICGKRTIVDYMFSLRNRVQRMLYKLRYDDDTYTLLLADSQEELTAYLADWDYPPIPQTINTLDEITHMIRKLKTEYGGHPEFDISPIN